MNNSRVSFYARRFAAFLCLALLLAIGNSAWAQLPRPLANPNFELRAPASGRDILALPDGGAIISGSFRWIGGDLQRAGLVRIAPDGSVNTAWNVSVSSGSVSDMALDGDNVYLAGNFYFVNGVDRGGLARVSLSTGTLDSWNPNAGSNSYASFNAIVVSGASVLVGGYFTQIGTTARTNVAKIATDSTGTLNTAWNPTINREVYALAIEGSSLFLGGYFDLVNGISRQYVAKIGIADAVLDASWAARFKGMSRA